MPHLEAYIAFSGRPSPLSHCGVMRLVQERAELLFDIEGELGHLTMLRAVAHDMGGMRLGARDDQSLTTAELRVALDTFRQVPTP